MQLKQHERIIEWDINGKEKSTADNARLVYNRTQETKNFKSEIA